MYMNMFNDTINGVLIFSNSKYFILVFKYTGLATFGSILSSTSV